MQIFGTTRPRAGLRPAGPRWIVGMVQFSWVHFSRLTSRLRHSARRGQIVFQKTYKTFLRTFGTNGVRSWTPWANTRTNGVPMGPPLSQNRDWRGAIVGPFLSQNQDERGANRPPLSQNQDKQGANGAPPDSGPEPEPGQTGCQLGHSWAKTGTNAGPKRAFRCSDVQIFQRENFDIFPKGKICNNIL